MKQFLFMIVVTAAGAGGSFVKDPFWGIAVYYLYAVLRPQFIWWWSLPPGYNWSRYAALSALVAWMAHKLGILSFPRLIQDELRVPRTWTAAHSCLYIFMGWALLSYFFGPYTHPDWGIFVLTEYTKFSIVILVATSVARRVGSLWFLFMTTTLSLIYISYEMNYLYLVNGNLFIYRNGFGGLDNNGAALMLAMGVPMCLFAWEGIRQWYRWAILAMIPVIIHAVLMSYSRGAMVSLIIASPLWWLRSWQRVRLGLIYGAVACMIPFLAGKEIQARFFSIEKHEADASANSRKQSWAAAIRIANDYPVFGSGIRGASVLSYRYGADIEGRTIHSQYLQLAADNGWVGMVLFIMVLLTVWWNTRLTRQMVKSRRDPEALRVHAIACGVEGSLAVYCIGAIFLSLEIFELPYLLFFLAAQLPHVVATYARTDAHSAPSSEPFAALHHSIATHARATTIST